jgi:hypothetical protein
VDIPVGYAQVNLLFTGPSLPYGAQATFGVDHSASSMTPAQVAEEVFDQYGAAQVYNGIAIGVNLSGVLVKFGPNTTGPSAIHSDTWNGQATGGAAAPNTSWLIRKITALGGHAGRGRMYLPGVPEEDIDDNGNIVSASREALEGDVGSMMAALVLANLDPVLLHAEGSPISTPTLITGWSVDTRVATQRRRLRR